MYIFEQIQKERGGGGEEGNKGCDLHSNCCVWTRQERYKHSKTSLTLSAVKGVSELKGYENQ